MRRLQKQDKIVFKINYTFNKDKKQQDLLLDSKDISDSIAYFTRVYMICLTFPSASQLALIG